MYYKVVGHESRTLDFKTSRHGRGEVQLSEARDALVRAEDTEVTALAQLNNAMGRDASLPVRPGEVSPPDQFTASLAAPPPPRAISSLAPDW